MNNLSLILAKYYAKEGLSVTEVIDSDYMSKNYENNLSQPLHVKLLLSDLSVCVLTFSNTMNMAFADASQAYLENPTTKNFYRRLDDEIKALNLDKEEIKKELLSNVMKTGKPENLDNLASLCANAKYFTVVESINYGGILNPDLDYYTKVPVKCEAFISDNFSVKDVKLSHQDQVLEVLYTGESKYKTYVGFNPFEVSLKASSDWKERSKFVFGELSKCIVIKYLETLLDRTEARNFYYAPENDLIAFRENQELFKNKKFLNDDISGYNAIDMISRRDGVVAYFEPKNRNITYAYNQSNFFIESHNFNNEEVLKNDLRLYKNI